MSDALYAAGLGGRFATARRSTIEEDVPFIQDKRREGVPDTAIARMIGRGVADVRAIPRPKCEPPQRPPPELCERPTVVLSLFKGLIRRVPGRNDGMWEICQEIAAKHGVTLDELRGPERTKRVCVPRQEAMWAIYRTGRYSLPQIGRYLGGRDHTSVLHGVRRHEERLAEGAE